MTPIASIPDLLFRLNRRSKQEWDTLNFFLSRKGAMLRRVVKRERSNAGVDFTMLCVQRPVYVKFAISSINSLHLFNPAHRVRLNLDKTCQSAFDRMRGKLDYPGMVSAVLLEEEKDVPWQISKLRLVLRASMENSAFVDADTYWRGDPGPLILKDRAMFLVKNYRFDEALREKSFLEENLGHPEWVAWGHYNTTFVSIPASMITQDFVDVSLSLANEIFHHKANPKMSEEDTKSLRRLCEEISLSIAAQLAFGEKLIDTLKERELLAGRTLLDSFYYGACHGVD